MSKTALPDDRASNGGRIVIILALLAIVVLLLGILFMLFSISRNGLNIRLEGDFNLSELGEHITVELTMAEPITLALPQPLEMVAAGPDGDPIPATLAFASCPDCNSPMLPSTWNLWNGRIEWTCPVVDESHSVPATP